MHFQGVVFHAHNPYWSWSPLSGEGALKRGGRFNRVDVPALYTSLSPMTVLREVGFLQQRLQPHLLCACDVDAQPVFDALDVSQMRAFGLADEDLRCPSWEKQMLDGTIPASQRLADQLIAAGYVGMRTPSFAQGAGADDLNLVFWSWGDHLPSRVLLIDDERRLALRWRTQGQETPESRG